MPSRCGIAKNFFPAVKRVLLYAGSDGMVRKHMACSLLKDGETQCCQIVGIHRKAYTMLAEKDRHSRINPIDCPFLK
jgi:hypothetical protein